MGALLQGASTRRTWRFGYWHAALTALLLAGQVAVVVTMTVGFGVAVFGDEPVAGALLWSMCAGLFFAIPVAVVVRSRRRNFVEIDAETRVIKVRRRGEDEDVPFERAQFRIPPKPALPNPPFLQCRIGGVRDIDLPFLQQGMYVTPRKLARLKESLDHLGIAWTLVE